MTKKEGFKKAAIEVKPSIIHRYGVFAVQNIMPEEVIEECPVIIFQPLVNERRSSLGDRIFGWGGDKHALALGYGSVYNHADDFNANAITDIEKEEIRIVAIKPIKAGEEIFINYGKAWFDSRNMVVESPDTQEKKTNQWLLKIFILLMGILVLSKIFPIESCSIFSNKAQASHKVAGTE